MAGRLSMWMAGLAVSVGLLICTAGCAFPSAKQEVRDEMVSPASVSFAAPEVRGSEGSLFKEDQAVLSNSDFEKILAAKVVLTGRSKLAVVRFGQMPYWWGWSEDFVRMNEQIDTDFLRELGACEKIREVAYLPSLVTPREMAIPYLRQAAARFQADLLLVYRTSTQTYNRQKVFAKDQGKAYCTVEAVLLDTRTGLIPFSTVLTESYSTTRTTDDANLFEMTARAQQQAVAKAWMRLAKQVVEHVGSLPGPATAEK